MRVHVQIAAQVGAIDEAGQLRGRAAASISPRILAQLRRNPGEAERLVDRLPRVSPATALVVVDAEQPVFVQLEAEADRAIAQRDVVRLRAGEVLQRGAAALGGDQPQVGLEAAAEEHARFRVAVRRARARPAGSSTKSSISDAGRRRRRGCRGRRRCRSRAAGCRPASIAASGRALAQVATRAPRATSCASDSRCRPACRLRSSSALRISASFFAPMPAQRADAAVGARRARDRRACGCRARGTASRRSSGRRPAGAAGRGSSAGTRRAARGGYGDRRSSAISRMRAARSLPMPGISRRPASSSARELVRMVGDDVGAVAVRANLERVVVLDLEEIGDLPEDARDRGVIQAAGLRSRCGSRAARAPPAASASAIGRARGRAGRSRTGSRRRRRRTPWPPSRRPPSRAAISSSIVGVVTPGASRLRLSHSIGDLPADFVPVAALRAPSASPTAVSRIRSKQSKTCAIAVDVPLGDLPVVRAGVARRAGVGEHDAALELARIDVERDAADAVDAELDRGDAAVQRRPIVLHAGRHADRLALDVHRHLQQVARDPSDAAGPAGERAADGDRQRRRAGDAGAGRRLAARGQRRVLEPVVARQQRQQRQVARRRRAPTSVGALTRAVGVDRAQLDARRRSRGSICACARRLIAAFSVVAPSWKR